MDAMTALENSLRDGTLNEKALEELKKPESQKINFFDSYCDLYPSEPECKLYDC